MFIPLPVKVGFVDNLENLVISVLFTYKISCLLQYARTSLKTPSHHRRNFEPFLLCMICNVKSDHTILNISEMTYEWNNVFKKSLKLNTELNMSSHQIEIIKKKFFINRNKYSAAKYMKKNLYPNKSNCL